MNPGIDCTLRLYLSRAALLVYITSGAVESVCGLVLARPFSRYSSSMSYMCWSVGVFLKEGEAAHAARWR